MFTTDRPVTQTADVTVNRQFKTDKSELTLANGKHKRTVPNTISPTKNNIIGNNAELFFIKIFIMKLLLFQPIV